MLRTLLAGIVVLGFGAACGGAASSAPAPPTEIATMALETSAAQPAVTDPSTNVSTAQQQPPPDQDETPVAQETADDTAPEVREDQPSATPEPTPKPTAPVQQDQPTPTPEPTPEPTVPSPAVGSNMGNLAPSFTLPSAAGPNVSIKSYRGDKNLVVVFYRAFW